MPSISTPFSLLGILVNRPNRSSFLSSFLRLTDSGAEASAPLGVKTHPEDVVPAFLMLYVQEAFVVLFAGSIGANLFSYKRM